MDAIQASDLKKASILNTLLFENKAVEEAVLLENLVEESLGLIDLNHEAAFAQEFRVDLSLCWVTFTCRLIRSRTPIWWPHAIIKQTGKEALGGSSRRECSLVWGLDELNQTGTRPTGGSACR